VFSVRFQLIYYADKFTDWVNTFQSDKFSGNIEDEQRIVLPFISSEDSAFFGCSARTILNKEPRYYTISLEHDGDYPRLYGYERVDTTREYCLVEGPIDSLFIDNCAAMNKLKVNLKTIRNKEKCIIALDNQPRHKDVVKAMTNLVENGFKICIWPEDNPYKDINLMIKAGLDANKIIYNNVYSGLSAKLKLANWSRI
jgi:hypothetical protein